MVKRTFITGANRGIGLALVRQYLEQPDSQIFAACRYPETANELNDLVIAHPDRVVVIGMEVTSATSLNKAAQSLRTYTDGIEIFINNAGINPPRQTFEEISPETIRQIFEVNSIAPLMVTRAFVDFLKHGKNARLVNISSALGSLTLRQSTGYYGYNASKAALNMFTRMLAVELSPFGIVTVTVHPGWVQTDMGGRGAPLTPQESVQGLIKLIDGLTASHNGLYYRWDGEALPW